MTTPSAKLLVLVSGQWACIKIVGRANFTSSIEFKTLVNELVKQHYSSFLLDLSGCVLMDSTFLGILAGFGQDMNGASNGNGQPHGQPVELLNPNARILELLENLGMAHIFKVISGTVALPRDCSSPELPESPQPTRDDFKRTCLKAHEILMALDPANISKFKDVGIFLAEEGQKKVAS